MQETRVGPGSTRVLVWEDPLEREWQSLQYSCLENPMDREAWQAIVCGVSKSQMQLPVTLSRPLLLFYKILTLNVPERLKFY